MENTVNKHICGMCNDEWLTEAEYLAHTCPSTSANPTQAAHQGPEFVAVQAAALARGLELLQNENQDVSRQQAAIDQHAADNGLTTDAAV